MAQGGVGFMVVRSPCEEGERAGGDGGSVIACNNGIESEGGWLGDETHLVMRIDGLDRVGFAVRGRMPSGFCGMDPEDFQRGGDDVRTRAVEVPARRVFK